MVEQEKNQRHLRNWNQMRIQNDILRRQRRRQERQRRQEGRQERQREYEEETNRLIMANEMLRQEIIEKERLTMQIKEETNIQRNRLANLEAEIDMEKRMMEIRDMKLKK